MDAVEIEGLRIAYERVGAGPSLLLLHGNVGDARTTWGQQLDALSDSFTVVAWDAPGAGGSSDPPDGFAMDGYAECLARFVAGLHLGRPHVIGLSFGGALPLALNRRHAQMPTTLTLVSAYAGWAGSLSADIAEQRLRQAYVLADRTPEDFVATLLPTMFSEGTPDRTIDVFRGAMLAFHPRGFRAMARASAENLRDALPLVDVPTLLVYGDRDAARAARRG